MATKTKTKEPEATPAVPAPAEPIPLSQNTETLIREINELNTATYRFLEAAAFQISRNAFEIGKRLCELKEQCAHGEWLVALGQVQYSEDKAQRMMKIYREYDLEVKVFQNLNYSQMVALFPVPVGERQAFAEKNDVPNLSVTEIKQLIKQKETAEKENARLAKQLDSEISRREQQEKATATNKDLQKRLESSNKDLMKSAGEIDKLKKELEVARSTPPTEVKIYEPSELQIEEIRKKAYDQAKADADKEAAAAIDAEVEKRCAIYDEQMQRKTYEEDPGIMAINVILNQIRPLLDLMDMELARIDDPKIAKKTFCAIDASFLDVFGDQWSKRHEDQ